MYKVTATLNTNGNGYWSNKRKAVDITGLQLSYTNDELDFGELRVFFNTNGLVYTDPLFLFELREYLVSLGFTAEEAQDVSYSEQGMQTDAYVSCDVGLDFINGLTRLDPAHVNAVYANCT